MTLQDWRTPPPAPALVLAFLATARDDTASASQLVRMGAVFGVDARAMRVALGRLVRDGLLRQAGRGLYGVGGAGAAVQARVRDWRRLEERVRPWSGGWTLVLVDHLGRTDRKRLRRRERALRLGGLAHAPEGFWVRPDNLQLTPADFLAQLVALGLDEGAALFSEARTLGEQDARLRALWSGDALSADYAAWTERLAESAARLPALAPSEAARESFLLGQAVLRTINLDPLLPAELVDVGRRRALVAAMADYDRLGKGCWAALDF